MRDHTLVVARQGPILESCGKGGPERRRLHCRNINGRDRRCERFDRDYALRLGVLADLQSDKNERCQQGTSADDLGQSRELLECHRSNNSRAPHTLHSRNPRADASLSEGATTHCGQPLICVRWPVGVTTGFNSILPPCEMITALAAETLLVSVLAW